MRGVEPGGGAIALRQTAPCCRGSDSFALHSQISDSLTIPIRDGMRRPAPQRDAISSQMDAHSKYKPERTPAMKKHNTERREQKSKGRKTIGLDLGDRMSRYCVVDEQGEVILEGSVATTESALRSWVEEMGPCVVAMEVGTHSPWVSRLL